MSISTELNFFASFPRISSSLADLKAATSVSIVLRIIL
jgi:hypothetical protein